jgi:diguanylate cyclase (GGDEF)-like protein/PAS domain S-box-containing protein
MNRKLFEKAVETMQLGVTFTDLTGRILYTNQAEADLHGYTREELRGRDARIFSPPESWNPLTPERARNAGRWKRERLNVRKDGTAFPVQLLSDIVTDAGGNPVGIVTTCEEITERYVRAFRLSAAGMALLDLDGRHVHVNAAYARVLGWTEEELRSRDLSGFVHPEDLAGVNEVAARVIAGDPTDEPMEVRFIHRDDRPIWVLRSVALLPGSAGEPAGLVTQIQDITEKKRAEDALSASEESYRLLFERNLAGIYRIRLDGTIRNCNEAFARILGWEREELIGRNIQNLLLDGTFRSSLLPRLERLGNLSNVEARLRHRDGSTVWVLENLTKTDEAPSGAPFIEGIIVDITSRKRAEDRLLHDALHDALTGLANRALFMDRLDHVIRRARRQGFLFAVLFLDLDRFKLVNDSFGHLSGDQLLVAVAVRIASAIRTEDTVARIGGDEFAVLLDGIRDEEEAHQAAVRLQGSLARPFDAGGRDVFVTASIGIAVGNGDGRPDDLLRDADTAMYHAKAAGKAQFAVFEPSMRERAVATLQLETALRQAVERKEFEVHYQPILSLGDGRITGFEALVRWHHPERGLLFPADFLELAEETGLILPIGDYVLEESCRQLRAWQLEYPMTPPLSMSVNLSARQFRQADLFEQVRRLLEETGIASGSLALEMTEGILVENTESAMDLLSRLRSIGVKISIDDFGTGYSSLSYLHWLPLDRLKIDRSFVSGMSENPRNQEILRTIANLAKNLGMDVVAEGVETEDQLTQLRLLPCGFGQGFYFSKAQGGDAAREMIAKGLGPLSGR